MAKHTQTGPPKSKRRAAPKPAAVAPGAGASTATARSNDGAGTAAPAKKKYRYAGPGGEKVVAERPGFYDNARRREGDVFIVKEGDPIGSWMAPADAKAKEHTTRSSEALSKAQGDIKGRPTGKDAEII